MEAVRIIASRLMPVECEKCRIRSAKARLFIVVDEKIAGRAQRGCFGRDKRLACPLETLVGRVGRSSLPMLATKGNAVVVGMMREYPKLKPSLLSSAQADL